MDENDLPFKVGQLAEARSFAQGYRGAWFRCKIIDIARRDSGMLYALQYYDFPDEKLNWTKLYQYPKPRLKNTERQLMVRPCFPSVYRENKLSEIKTISEVVVVVNDVWKVGDFVDWWTDGCYWSGRLTKALGNEKYLIDLFPPPAGEGSSYEASSKDFRPSLSWSLDNGWIVPIPSVIDNHHPCARLIKPLNQGSSTNLAIQAADKGRKDPDATVRASNELNASISSQDAIIRFKLMRKGPFSSHIATSRFELMGKGPLNPAASNETRTSGRNTGLDETNGGATKSSCSDSQSSPGVRGALAEVAEAASDKGRKDPEATVRASSKLNASLSSQDATIRFKLMGKGLFSSHIATRRSELMGKGPLNPATSNETRTPGRNTSLDETNGGATKSSFSDSQSSPHVRGALAEVAEAAADKRRKDPEATVNASSKLNASFSSHIATSRSKILGKGPFSSHIATSRSELMGKGPMNPAASNETRTPGRNTGLDETNGGATKSSCSDNQSSPGVRGALAEVAEAAADKGRKDPEATGRASSKLNASISSHIETSRSELMGKGQLNPAASNETRTPGRNTGLDETNGGATKSSCSDSQSSPHVRGASAEVAEDTGGKDNDSNDPPLKKMKTDGGMYLDSTCSDTIESAILDLEVLVNRIKWMKDALKFGLPLSNTATQSWKFLEHRGPSRPK
ncbi:hypothetical protein OIU76_014129 [Salix suchowensis]|uniref:Agenet domain-containing protein n=1 Tax=Salix suchowensis TaxID=1278906 RepID=A0ABQ9A103_9ROSI|nr:hypothetical protein OIU76_014129 [Salix suchowensis]KAJ6321632.1 hypothetical protein OIU77_011662 [Salix suchowensis]